MKQQQQQQKSNISHLTESLKATPEQMRLASILSPKSDADIDTKIKLVLDIVPNVKSDYISIVLHDQDYDVQRTVDFILEHGHSEVEADWQTAGQKKKPTDQSANDAVESNNRPINNKVTNKKGNRGSATNGQNFHQQNKQNKKNDAKFKEINSKMENMSLSKNETSGENNSNQNDSNEEQTNKAHNKRDGSFAKPQRNGRNFKSNRNERHDYQKNLSENNKLDSLENTNGTTKENFANKVKTNGNGSDNLRDIGTWNTEPSNNRRSSNNRHNNRDKSNNKFNNSNNNTGNAEDWENEDEWQGDLTQTQIFTSSVQKRDQSKDSNEVEPSANTFTDKNNNNANANVPNNQANNTNDFPIGHFNAEEAAQNIKKAVGIGAKPSSGQQPTQQQTQLPVTAQPDLVVKKPTTNTSQTAVANSATQQNQSMNKNIKLPTAKIPPPSTKIPKSAVVMPDGTNSSINLDVQFGIDLYTPNLTKKEKENEKQDKQAVNLPNTNTGNKVNEPAQTQIQIQNLQPHQQQPQQQQQQQKPKVVNNTQNKNVALNSLMNKPLENQIVTNTNTNNNNLAKTNTDTLMRVAESQSTTTNVNSLESMQKSQQQQQFVDNKPKQAQYNQTFNNNNVNHQQQQHQMMNKPQQQVPQQQQQPQQSQQQQQQQPHQTNPQTHNINAANNKPLISPKNLPTSNNPTNNTNGNSLGALNANLKNQQQSQVQSQVSHTNSNGNLSQLQQLSQTNQPANASNATQANNMKPSTQMAPPPGVNLLNPNNQFLMGLPFVCYDQQNFSYFDPAQLDSNLIQMYNHLASVPPPGVTGAPSAAAAAAAAAAAVSANQTGQYSDNKFTRTELNSAANSQLNASQLAQQQSQQQQQPINLIPNLSNFPFFFPNYYPNVFMSMPNAAPQQTNPQQFPNKLPYNFANNASGASNAYNDDQSKDYQNYNAQSQLKSANNSNLNNDLSAYQKNVSEKANTTSAGGYHTPSPNFPNALLNSQLAASQSTAPVQPTPAQYAYMQSMMGGVHPGGMQQVNY